MYVSIDFLRRFQLNNQVYLRNVKTPCSHVGCHQAFQFSLFEGLESDFPLLLRDVSMQNLSLLLEIGLQKDLIGLSLRLTEDDGSTMTTSVKVDDVRDDRVAVVIRTVEGQVFDCL